MPRRIHGHGAATVDEPMERAFAQLSEVESTAAELLGLDQIWDEQLATFHNSLWQLPGVTLTDAMFTRVLATLRRMAKQQMNPIEVADLLLNLERLITPKMGAAICKTLDANAVVREHAERRHCFPFPALVASFLTDPLRFVDIAHPCTLSMCWDDHLSGCVWGNANGGYADEESDSDGEGAQSDASCATSTSTSCAADDVLRARTAAASLEDIDEVYSLTGAVPETVPKGVATGLGSEPCGGTSSAHPSRRRKLPTYQSMLVQRHRTNVRRRLTAGPILVGSLPSSVRARNEAAAVLPVLPEAVARIVLALSDDTGPLDPFLCRWLVCYGESWTASPDARRRYAASVG